MVAGHWGRVLDEARSLRPTPAVGRRAALVGADGRLLGAATAGAKQWAAKSIDNMCRSICLADSQGTCYRAGGGTPRSWLGLRHEMKDTSWWAALPGDPPGRRYNGDLS
jgi:hypothetical protein